MPIKTIKGDGTPGIQGKGLRAQVSDLDTTIDGRARQIKTTLYTNKLNKMDGTGLIKFPITNWLFTAPYYDNSTYFQDPKDTGGFKSVCYSPELKLIFCGAPYQSTTTSSTATTGYRMGKVYIYDAANDYSLHAVVPAFFGTSSAQYFGTSVAYDYANQKLIISAAKYSNGRDLIYVYDYDGSSKFETDDWGTPVIIFPSDRNADPGASNRDFFGGIVKTINGKIITTAENSFTGTNKKGAVYVYDLDGTNEVRIVPSASGFTNTNLPDFACALDVDGNDTDGYKMIVGCSNYGENIGNRYGGAFIFNLDGTGEVKLYPDRLIHDGSGIANNASRLSNGGRTVAIDVAAGKAFVGGPYNNSMVYGSSGGNYSGMIHVFNLDGTGQLDLFPTPPSPRTPYFSRFGSCMAIDRSTGRLITKNNGGDLAFNKHFVSMDYDGSNERFTYWQVNTLDGTPVEKPFGKGPWNLNRNDGQQRVVLETGGASYPSGQYVVETAFFLSGDGQEHSSNNGGTVVLPGGSLLRVGVTRFYQNYGSQSTSNLKAGWGGIIFGIVNS